jgi:hypothetical protein
MGEFMKNGVEIFTPWSWDIGMWEALHLFSRYNQENYVQSVSQDETLISAYPTTDVNKDYLTVVLVNRSLTEKKLVNLNFTGYTMGLSAFPIYSLSQLGANETFVSHLNNALVKSEVIASSNQISVELAPLSVNTILLRSNVVGTKPDYQKSNFKGSAYPNPASNQVNLDFSLPEKTKMSISLYNTNGQFLKTVVSSVFEAGSHQVNLDTSFITEGVYFIKFNSENMVQTIKLFKHN